MQKKTIFDLQSNEAKFAVFCWGIQTNKVWLPLQIICRELDIFDHSKNIDRLHHIFFHQQWMVYRTYYYLGLINRNLLRNMQTNSIKALAIFSINLMQLKHVNIFTNSNETFFFTKLTELSNLSETWRLNSINLWWAVVLYNITIIVAMPSLISILLRNCYIRHKLKC